MKHKINKEANRSDKPIETLGLTPNQIKAMKKLASLDSFDILEVVNWNKVSKKFFELLSKE